MAEITYDQLIDDLEKLPNIERDIVLKMDEANKRQLSRRRSNIYGSASKK
jgi:hypothetical protein